jgi:tRNA(fMet)-specific endonuclease VapC
MLMDSVVVDTDVFSFFFRKDTRRELYRRDIEGHRLCLAFQSVAEVRMGALYAEWGKQRLSQLVRTLRHYVILPYDHETADRWAEICVHRRRAGKPIACGDAWIAAVALRHGLPLITHNRPHFGDIPHLGLICYSEQGDSGGETTGNPNRK